MENLISKVLFGVGKKASESYSILFGHEPQVPAKFKA